MATRSLLIVSQERNNYIGLLIKLRIIFQIVHRSILDVSGNVLDNVGIVHIKALLCDDLKHILFSIGIFIGIIFVNKLTVSELSLGVYAEIFTHTYTISLIVIVLQRIASVVNVIKYNVICRDLISGATYYKIIRQQILTRI